MMHMCPSRDKDLDLEGNKVLQPTIKDSEDCLGKFCFMTTEEEREDLERTIKDSIQKQFAWQRRSRSLQRNWWHSLEKMMIKRRKEAIWKEACRSKGKM